MYIFLLSKDCFYEEKGMKATATFGPIVCHCMWRTTKHVGEWLKQKDDKYTNNQIQNEILNILAFLQFQRMKQLTSNCEQATIMVQSVTDEMEVLKKFIHLYQVSSIGSSTLTN